MNMREKDTRLDNTSELSRWAETQVRIIKFYAWIHKILCGPEQNKLWLVIEERLNE